MNVLFLTQYFPPEIGAAQSRLGYYVRFFKRHGKVWVVAANPNYPELKVFAGPNRLRTTSSYEGVDVFRSWIAEAKNDGFIQRMKLFLSFAFSALLNLFRVKRGSIDFIFVEAPPIFLCLTGYLYAKFHGAKLVVHVSDLWVDAAINFGYIKNRFLQKIAKSIEDFMFRLADGLVTVTDTLEQKVKRYGLPVLLASNGVDETVFKPLTEAVEKKEQFTAVYAGTFGKVHGLDVIVDCAEIAQKNSDNIRFLLIGDGSEKKRILEYAKSKSLKNIEFTDSLKEEDLNRVLNSCHVALSTLKKAEFAASTRPVKVFMYMAVGLPVVISKIGESYEIFKERDGNSVFFYEPGSAKSLYEKITEAKNSLKYFGPEDNREFILSHYTREASCEKIKEFFEDMVRGS